MTLFLALGTQWRWLTGPMGGATRTGLDYSAIPAVAAAIGVAVTGAVFSDIRTMEGAAIAVFAG